jgi:hypothetical protein
MPSKGLILSWNCHFKVDTSHPLRHYWKLQVTEILFADDYAICAETNPIMKKGWWMS